MIRVRLAITGCVVMFLAAGWLMGQDTKTADTPAKGKGALPLYFKSLGLTDEQRQKVVKIHASYKSKLDSLSEQIKQLKNEERAELNKVLSETQRQRLRELQTHETETKEGAPATEKKDAPKKEEKSKAD
jgi:Spy/CpxP family protein refolding chaperone